MSHDGGTYQISLEVRKPISVVVGKLGRFDFEPGIYIYTGRARRGLQSRISRHQLRVKPLYWHIDYLLTHPSVRILEINVVSKDANAECIENQHLLEKKNVKVPVKGFGASDCRMGCPAHLFWVGGVDIDLV